MYVERKIVSGDVVLITGFLKAHREALTKSVAAEGAKVVRKLADKTNLVMVGYNDKSGNKKFTEAKRRGIEIIRQHSLIDRITEINLFSD